MKVVMLAAIAALVVVRPDSADACSCGMPKIHISPGETLTAPVNTHVFVWIPLNVTKYEKVDVKLRKKGGGVVDAERKRLGSASVDVLEFVPKAQLTAKTTYEVVATYKDKTEEVVGKLTTGDAKATKVPAWKGVVSSKTVKEKVACCMCQTGEMFAQVEVGDGSKDADDSLEHYAVWIAGADGKVDYARSPSTIVNGSFDTLWLGHASTCGSANFRMPASGKLKLGLKKIDVAGNTSAASEITLDLDHPQPN
jgi:hypothetical protein